MYSDKVFFKIVIPNYNNGKWIEKCVMSILNQTFRDFVVVVVDDCSNDSSVENLWKYKEKYSNLFLIKSMKKLFQSSARNIGYEYPIKSDYVLFMDGDDWLHDENVLADVHKILSVENPDMLIGRYEDVYPDRSIISKSQVFDVNSKSFSYLTGFYCWIRFVKSEKVTPFPDNLCCGEDIYQYFTQCDVVNKIKFIDRVITCHNHMNETSVMTPGSYKNIVRNRGQFDYFMRLLFLLGERKIKNPYIRMAVFSEMMLYKRRIIDFMTKIKAEDYV